MRILKYFSKYKFSTIMVPVLIAIEVLGEVLQPRLMANIVDIGIKNGDIGYIINTGLIMVACATIAMVAGMGAAMFSATSTQGMGYELRESLFSKIQTFSFKNIDKFSSASLVTRMTNDVASIQMTANMALRILVRAPLMLISGTVLALSINTKLAMILLAAIPVIAIAASIMVRKSLPLFVNVQARLDDVNSTVQENLTNIRVVKSFVRRDLEIGKFKKATENLKSAAIKAFNLIVFSFPLVMLIMNMTTIAVLWFGGNMIMNGTLKYGMLISFFTYIFQILFSFLMLAMIIMNMSQARASLARIYEVLDTESEINDGEDENAVVTKGKVEFRNVSFKYDENSEECVLKDISFTAEPGEFVAIVGQTGSAKTSLVQLIPRMYDVTQGQVLVDGIDVRNYKLGRLRGGIGIVMQKNNLFSGSISNNIKWGKQNAAEQEIENAAKIAQAHDFITQMQQGYNSELVSGGLNLSGGQRQRVCIARAIIKKPPILILDDSTSAVDSATERKIREELNSNLKDTTVFIIAQRISSVRDADKIIVLDNGAIAGIGSHEELLKNNECYRAIYYSQQREVKE